MVLLQALLAMLSRSAGKILNTVFGWSVRALFGVTYGAEGMILTALVAMASLWPLLVIGIVAPRIATVALTFIHVPDTVPSYVIRLVWVALAVIVPGAVGVALAAKAQGETRRDPIWLRVARGYPVTIALAVAFLLTVIAVPLRWLMAKLRRQREAQIPLITKADSYEVVAETAYSVLNTHGFDLTPQQASFWVRAPMIVMRKLGGAPLRRFVPDRLAYFRGPQLEVTFYPNSFLLRGPGQKSAIAHGLLMEALTPCDALQTSASEAQQLEQEIKTMWNGLAKGTPAEDLQDAFQQLAEKIARLEVAYDDWQILYRQALQLTRALQGKPQLLEKTIEREQNETDKDDREQDEVPSSSRRRPSAPRISTSRTPRTAPTRRTGTDR